MQMRYLIILIVIAGIFAACEEYEIETPVISEFTASKTSGTVGDTVLFTINTLADHTVLWFGDSESDYYGLQDLLNNPNKEENVTRDYPEGVILTEDEYTGEAPIEHIYSEAGQFKVVLIVRNIGGLDGETKEKQQEISITINE